MSFSNRTIIERFINGKTNGINHSMKIVGDRLFSYHCCIAIRDDDKFIISNKARYLGGEPHSIATSAHILLANYRIEKSGKPIMLVDGWAEKGKERWIIPDLPTHNHLWSLLRSVRISPWRYKMWTGEWFKDGTKRIDWHFNDGKLFSPDGKLVAIREFAHTYSVSYEEPCNHNCDACPARWECRTTKHFYGVVFFIIKGTGYEKIAKRFLRPSEVIDYTPTNGIVGSQR